MIARREFAGSPPAPIPPNPGDFSDRAYALEQVVARAKVLRAAIIASERRADQRGALDPGSSRASITTANARWMRAAEDRDRKEHNFILALEFAGYAMPEKN